MFWIFLTGIQVVVATWPWATEEPWHPYVQAFMWGTVTIFVLLSIRDSIRKE
jgi:hypothetical protein